MSSAAVRVSNIAPAITLDNIRDLFAECGKITHIHTEQQGDLTIQYAAEQEAAVAALLDDVPLGGRQLKVQRVNYLIDQQKTSQSLENNNVARTLYVGNITLNTTPEHITKFFADTAKVSYVKMCTNSNDSSTYCFVEFNTVEDAKKAKELNGTLFDGRNIKIGPAQVPITKPPSIKPPSKSPEKKSISDIQKKIEEAKQRLQKKYTDNTSKSDSDIEKDSSKHSRSRRRRSRSRSRSRSSSRSRRRRHRHRRHRSRSQSRDRRSRSRSHRRSHRRDRDHSGRHRRHRSRSRSVSRPRQEHVREKKPDPHEGMFWDGFQWIPAAAAGAVASSNVPGLGFGISKKL